MSHTLALTLFEGRPEFTTTGVASLYDTLPVVATGKTWDTGHTYLALLFRGTTKMGSADAVTVAFDDDGIATWTYDFSFTHADLLSLVTSVPVQCTFGLWDATAERWVFKGLLPIHYAVAPTGFVASDPTVTPATAGQIATAIATHNGATDAHSATFTAAAAVASAALLAHNRSEASHADIRAAMVSWPTADGEQLAASNRFAVGQYIGSAWVWCAKTGTQLLAWLGATFATKGANSDITSLSGLTTPLSVAQGGTAGATAAAARAGIGAYRAQTTASATDVSGSIALNFTNSLTLQHALTDHCTALTEPTGLADGEDGAALFTPGAFSMPASPAAGQRWDSNAWTVSGSYVEVIVRRRGSYYYWSANSWEVAT